MVISVKTVDVPGVSLNVTVYVVPGGLSWPDGFIGFISNDIEFPGQIPVEFPVPKRTYGFDPEYILYVPVIVHPK